MGAEPSYNHSQRNFPIYGISSRGFAVRTTMASRFKPQVNFLLTGSPMFANAKIFGAHDLTLLCTEGQAKGPFAAE